MLQKHFYESLTLELLYMSYQTNISHMQILYLLKKDPYPRFFDAEIVLLA